MINYNHLKEKLTLKDHDYEFYNIENLDREKYGEYKTFVYKY